MLKLPTYLVDDDESVLDSLAFLLEEYGYTITCFSNGKDFLEQTPLAQAGCVVLDSRMPLMRGQQVHQHLKQQNSPLGVVYLTGHGDVPMAVEALQQGAVDFLQKPIDGLKLTKAIDKACNYSIQALKTHTIKQAFNALTEREKDILSLVIKGMKNQQIADELCIAVRTVEVHRSSLMKKFSTKSVAELVMQYSQLTL
ncbi:response regulator transcription factor [Vibrio casei]|uniref:DNA-binding response regulator n=1 Tax=Vibrio casei TaxID=673372 RepID=A0A368LKE8_9VIBR|nr:response regulator [Vibrio casei]RCS72301.1 DNA-binding response regulator [Vibrio casei]SJN29898.1 Tetrathionate reductase two-component response regulator [Vibrio casei]